MPVAASQLKSQAKQRPAVLIVDDEPAMLELSSDILAREASGRVFQATSLAEARRIIDREPIALLIADVRLPDGDGSTLVEYLREVQPTAGAVVITGAATLEGSVRCFREGAIDYLPKPFTATQFADRISKALLYQDGLLKTERRLARLKSAVRKLNGARRTVSKKVDLLCNDLVAAYGDLARQFEDVRVKENFRKTITGAGDLEQMLCHSMDWLLRQSGYANIAIYLAGEEGAYELGAYMKYTLAGQKAVTDALCAGVVEKIARDDFVNLTDVEAAEALTPAELDHLPNMGVIGVNSTYLGESLATILMFRDGKSPFTNDDAAMLRAIAPIFAQVLTTLARTEGEAMADEDADADLDLADDEKSGTDKYDAGKYDAGKYDAGASEDNWAADEDDADEKRPKWKDPKPPKKPKKRDDADWWKRGESPPF
jgi:FixJ family two-component response regulator